LTTSGPTIGRAEVYETAKRFLDEALRAHSTFENHLIVVAGCRGTGKTRCLRDIAFLGLSAGYNIQKLRKDPSAKVDLNLASVRTHEDTPEDDSPTLIIEDEMNLDLLSVLGRELHACSSRTKSSRVYVVAVDTSAHALSDIVETVARSGGLVLRLTPLGLSEIELLINRTLGLTRVAPDALRMCVRETGGNPWLLSRLLATFLENRTLLIEDGCLALQEDFTVANNLDHISQYLQTVCNSLTGTKVEIASLLAASESQLSFDNLTQLTDHEPSMIRRACEDMLERGVLVTVPDDESSIRLANGLLATTLLRTLPRSEKLRLHGHLGRWYIAHPQSERGAEHAAKHFYTAEMREEAIRYSLLAARAAEVRFDHHTAALHYTRVLSMNPDHLEVQKQATLGLASVEHALGLSREALDRLNRFALEAKLSPSNLVEL